MALKKRYKIRMIVQSLRTGKLLYQSIKEAGMSRTTFYAWMNKNSRLKNLIEKTQAYCVDTRVGMIEDALFKSAHGGNLGAQIFFLTNMASNRWKNNRDRFMPPSQDEIALQNAEVEILSPSQAKQADKLLKEFME